MADQTPPSDKGNSPAAPTATNTPRTGKPLADFLQYLATNPNKAAEFKATPATVLKDFPELTAGQVNALKSGCVRDVLRELIGGQASGQKEGMVYFLDPQGVTCGHADCQEFNKKAQGK